jgi:hypothetical protein
VLAQEPDVVIVATGGLPDTEVLKARQRAGGVGLGHHFRGRQTGAANVLIFDDAGDHAALQAADVIAQSGATSWKSSPRTASFSPEVMAMNLVPYMRSLQDLDVAFTVTYRVECGGAARRPVSAAIFRQRLRHR